MRLIDADALKNKLQQHHDFFVNAWGGFMGMPIQNKARCDELSNSIAEILNAPSIDICFCRECKYYDPPHVEDKGKRIEYNDLPEEAFDELGTGLVNLTYGVNIGGRCCVDYNYGYDEDKRVYRTEDDFCSRGERKDDE